MKLVDLGQVCGRAAHDLWLQIQRWWLDQISIIFAYEKERLRIVLDYFALIGGLKLDLLLVFNDTGYKLFCHSVIHIFK